MTKIHCSTNDDDAKVTLTYTHSQTTNSFS
jgi:hypothetical protein